MSFSYKFETLRSGSSYESNAQLEMSAHEEKVTEDVGAVAIEGNEETGVRYLVGERIKVLKPLHAQISALTEMMNRLFQCNSAKETTTAVTR